MSFYKVSNHLQTFFSTSRIVSRTRLLQTAHFKLLQQNAFFHRTPQCHTVKIFSFDESGSYYIAKSTPQPAHLQKVYDQTIKENRESHQMVTQLQGTLLTTLCKLMNAKKVLELGCFTGYSALCFAEGIKGNGAGAKVVSCENDQKYAKVALQNVKEAGMDDLIEIKVGDARDTLVY
jgi:predicted O-methyltransferase YrrM